MIPRSRQRRTGVSRSGVLAVLFILIIGVGLSLIKVQRYRITTKRSDCINNLRNIGFALHNYESAYGTFPTEQPEHASPTGFYNLIAFDFSLGDPSSQTPGPRGIDSFLCPARRSGPQASGKRDYGYVTFGHDQQGTKSQAALDYPGGFPPVSIFSHGVSNTAVLSHLWMDAGNYTTGRDPTDIDWTTNPPQNARPFPQPFEDSDPKGSNQHMGSPHLRTMPVLFLDNHVSNLSYTGFSAENWRAIWDVNNKTAIPLPE